MPIAHTLPARARLTTHSRRPRLFTSPVLWQALALAGLATVFVGLGVDAWRHGDGGSGEESLLTLANPGHAIAGLGLVLTAIGLLTSMSLSAARQAMAADRAIPPLALASAAWVAIAVTGVGALTYIAASGATVGHPHGPGASDAASLHDQAPGAMVHDHGAHPSFAAIMQSSDASLLPLFPAGTLQAHELPLLRLQLQESAAAAARFSTIDRAEAAGYRQSTTDVDAMGLHYLNLEYVTDGVFDPARPEGLLFSRVDGAEPTLVGVWYFQTPGVGPVSHEVAPEGFAGGLDYWHGHQNVCLPFETEGDSEQGCAARGGRFVADTRWMMHAWVVPAGDNPDGVFAYLNRDLQARQLAFHNGDPDSDGDGLSDSLELTYRHNPIVADSDEDGVVDGRDADWLRHALTDLPEGALESISLQERSALLGLVDGAGVQIAAGNVHEATEHLGQLRAKLDGCVLHATSSEWLRACERQTAVRHLIDLLITNLAG